jgi:hypothetical protein
VQIKREFPKFGPSLHFLWSLFRRRLKQIASHTSICMYLKGAHIWNEDCFLPVLCKSPPSLDPMWIFETLAIKAGTLNCLCSLFDVNDERARHDLTIPPRFGLSEVSRSEYYDLRLHVLLRSFFPNAFILVPAIFLHILFCRVECL